MKIREIARIGLRGRKKDSLLISLVISLAFIFIISAIIFQSSREKTKIEQAFDLYGQWHGAYLSGDEKILESLEKEKDIDKIGKSLIIGKTEKAGTLGTFNKELLEVARFSLYKGRYPEKDDEIMLELNQMSQMKLDLEVGQKVQININVPKFVDVKENFIKRSEELRSQSTSSDLDPIGDDLRDELFSLIDEIIDLVNPKNIEENFDQTMVKVKANYEKLIEVIDKLPLDFGMRYEYYLEDYGNLIDKMIALPLSKEELMYDLQSYGWTLEYLTKDMFATNYKTYKYNEVPFEKVGDTNVVLSNSYIHFYEEGDEVNPEIIREKGVLTEQSISLKKEFTVVGILESYSDKWDIGDYNVANAFITEEGGKHFTNAIYNNNLGDLSDHKLFYNLFLESKSLKSRLYSELANKYPDIERYDDNYYSTEYVDYFLSQYMGQERKTIEKAIESNQEWDDWEDWDVKRGDQEGKDDSLEGIWDSGEKMEVNNSNFRKNSFVYADENQSTESVLNLAIIAVIFIATALAIFQIFLTQMKARSRKLVLLRSIGATKGQIIKMVLYEGLHFLRNGLIFGFPIGFFASLLLVYGMNILGNRELRYYIRPSLLILGILAGILSLFVGMIIPMIYAIRIPLVGTMYKPPKHKKKKIRGDKVDYQSFSRINWNYIKINRGKTLISFGISFITIGILLSAVFLSYLSFNNYKTTVLEKSRPDYAFETIYGEANRILNEEKNELESIEGIKRTETYKVGKNLIFWYKDMEKNQIINDFEEVLPAELRKNYFNKYNSLLGTLGLDQHISHGFLTKIYGINPKDPLFDKYNRALTEGKIDKKKFESGEEVILMVPMYIEGKNKPKDVKLHTQDVIDNSNEDNRMSWLFENTGLYKQSYDIRYSKSYKKQNYLKVGDILYLSSDKEQVEGENYASKFVTKKLKIGGIIHYLPKGGDWPFSNSNSNYVVISSIRGMENIYPSSTRGLGNMELKHMESAIEVLYPTRYGRTLWYIYTDNIGEDIVLDSKLLAYGHNNNYSIYNYKESNAKLYQEGFNNALIIGLLGITASAIAFIILYNIMVSKIEQERNRIGILQALGVSREEFKNYYIRLGLINGLLALIGVNVLLFLLVFLGSLVENTFMTFGQRFRDVFIHGLWLYPWIVHIALSLIFLGITVLIYYLPSRKIIESSPVENIRSLSR